MVSAVERLRAKYEKDLRCAELEDQLNEFFIRHPLDASGDTANALHRRTFVHHKPLYAHVGTVKYGDEFSKSLCSWQQAVELMVLYPAEPLTRIRGGTLSFQPTEYVESLPEDLRRRTEELDVVPMVLHLDGSVSNYTIAELQWTTKTLHGLVRVEVYVPSSVNIVTAESKKRIRDGEVSYERPTVWRGRFLQPSSIKALAPSQERESYREEASELLEPIIWSGAPFSRAPITLCWGYPTPTTRFPTARAAERALDLLIHLTTLATVPTSGAHYSEPPTPREPPTLEPSRKEE